MMRRASVPIKILIAIAVLLFVITLLGAQLIYNLYVYDNSEYEITGLKVKQEGLTFDVSWNANSNCNEYAIMVFSGLNRPEREIVSGNHYEIKKVEVGSKYRVVVTAIDKDGMYKGATNQILTAKKAKQRVKVSQEECRGFSGDTFKIKATGKGDITYSSRNAKVATVSDNGKIKLLKSGETTIIAKASGNDEYRVGKKKIKILSYPDKLEAVKLKTSSKTSTMQTLKWSTNEYATAYELMLKNPATNKYEKIKTLDKDETSTTVVRTQGDYAIRAIATINDKTVSGKNSNSVSVSAYADKARSYSSKHIIKTLNKNNLNVVAMIQNPGSIDVPQSMCFNGSEYIISFVNQGGTKGMFRTFNRGGSLKRSQTVTGLGHANGSTYNPNTGKIYTVKTHKSVKSSSCSTYNESGLTSAGKFNLPRVTSGIAYDTTNDKYYLSKGSAVYVCNSSMKVERSIRKKAGYYHSQDIGAYNGVALVCTWVSGNKSSIDMYRISDGAYLGSFDVSIGEIESCVIDDGYLIILMNTRGSSRDYIYKTQERISIP